MRYSITLSRQISSRDINNARLCIRNEVNRTLAKYIYSVGCKGASDVGAQSSQT